MAEYTVGSRQKRRVAKEVSLAMELCFDQVPDIEVSAQAIRDEESNTSILIDDQQPVSTKHPSSLLL